MCVFPNLEVRDGISNTGTLGTISLLLTQQMKFITQILKLAIFTTSYTLRPLKFSVVALVSTKYYTISTYGVVSC